ncbi:MAG: alpha/beta fold hydrolase [Actinomycetes bacterium]
MRRLPAALAILGLAATGLVAAAPSGTAATVQAAPATSTITWGRCTDPSLVEFKARCGFVKVPLDYARPHGKKIKLAVSRVRHTVKKSKYQGVLLLNPGGPGGSGLSLSTLGPIISQGFGRRDVGGAYDWIGFDPRGVGSSEPSLSCDPDYMGPDRPDYVPSTPSLLRTWKARSRGYARACGKDAGALLAHMKTTDTVRDMDRIRAALGAKQINYYGFSYGTTLAQVYTALFPGRMRRMVLDSNVDPRDDGYAATFAQNLPFERNVQRFFAWMAAHDATFHLGTTRHEVASRWRYVQEQLRNKPIEGIVGPDEWTDIFLYAGYYQFLWPDLGDVFANYLTKGDAAAVVEAYRSFDTPGDDNSYAAFSAVTCTDSRWKGRDWIGDTWKSYYRAPFLSWANTWFTGPCFFWPAKAGSPTRITGRGVGRALLLDETFDAATPYPGSVYLRKIFTQSRLVAVVGGTTHAGTPSGNPCVDNKIFTYLALGTLPRRKAGAKADVRCAALAKPQPNAPAAFGAWSSSQTLARAASAGSAAAGRELVARMLLRANRY